MKRPPFFLPDPLSPVQSCFCSVFLYVARAKHRYLVPHLFKDKWECGIYTVLCFAFSLPVSWRSFHFCAKRASSFFFHCILFYGWVILYLISTRRPPWGTFGLFPSFCCCKQPAADSLVPALFCTMLGCRVNSQKRGCWSGLSGVKSPSSGDSAVHAWNTWEECSATPQSCRQRGVLSRETFDNPRWNMVFHDHINLHFSYKEVGHLSLWVRLFY